MAIDLFTPGAYCRAAGGNLERPDLQKPVCDWMAWSINADNGGNGSPDVWAPARKRWKAAGMADFPWMHVRSMADLQRLVSVGENTNAPAIGFNVEDVVGDKISLQAMGGFLLDFWVNKYEKPVHMPTLCWVQNGQGWQYVSFAVAALEIFVDEVPSCKDMQGCIDHAQAEGLPKVTLMLKTKPPNTKETYGSFWNVCHSLYTADDITPTVDEWLKWKAPTPCTRVQGGSTVLTPNQKKEFRRELAAFTFEAERFEHRWHYSQNRPYKGLGAAPQTFHTDDCSSYCALAFYWAAHHTPDVRVADPLDYHYSGYGNTQSAYEYLKAHKAPVDKYRIGDMAIYGPSFDTVHMMICRKAGTGRTAIWSSFGQEAGPEARTDIHYHPSPLLGIYRHPALL